MKKLKKRRYFSTAANASFHAFISTGYLQTVDMRYNIRGQLTSMNNSKLSNDGGVTNNDNTDLFGMQFYYDQANSNLNTTPKFNGRMTGVTWMSTDAGGNKSYDRSYIYKYDQVGRYYSSGYAERTPTSTVSYNNNVGGFNESGITYDAGGNILTLARNASTQGANSDYPIDNLTYTYSTTSPNQLQSVTDGAGATYTGAGFRNLTGSTGSYAYDANGNLAADPYKGLSISYNFLNKTGTTTVTTGSSQYINYTYDGAGNLIRKQEYNGTLGTTTDYIDGFVYLTQGTGTATLSYFPMPEGRVINYAGTLKQEFIITDQQGNARLAFQDSGNGTPVVTQENSYYAFGLIMPNSPVANPATPNKQLYNGGSEWQNDYSNNLPAYYQTVNRNYDAAIGRFVGVDPMAEGAESMSTYQYSGNNPVMFNDPMGNLLKLPTPSVSSPEGYSIGPGEGQSSADFFAWSDAVSLAGGYGAGGGTAGYNVFTAGASASEADANGATSVQDYSATEATAASAGMAAADQHISSNPTTNYDPNHITINQAIYKAPDNSGFWNGLNSVEFQGTTLPYVVTAGALNPNSRGWPGAVFVVRYYAPGNSPYKSYQWIQTVSQTPNFSHAGTTYENPFVDAQWEGHSPFYYGNSDFNSPFFTDDPLHPTTKFGDEPGSLIPNLSFQAETTLVGLNAAGKMSAILTFNWGYTITNGVSSFNGWSQSPAPSVFQNQLINLYNSTH